VKIFVADNVPDRAEAERTQKALQVATQHSGLVTAVGDRCWRDSEADIDQALVGADEQGSPLPIDEVLCPGQGDLKASLYMMLAENVAMASVQHTEQVTTSALQ